MPPEAVVMADSGEGRVGTFHSKCGMGVWLSEGRRVARGIGLGSQFAFSSEPIPIGLQFSVKILQEGFWVSPISASSRPHLSDAPYTAGGAVHVVHCCLFFAYCDGVEGT